MIFDDHGGINMKKQVWRISVLLLMVAFILRAYGAAPEDGDRETTAPAVITGEAAEPEEGLDPEWLSDAAIDEAYACLFPVEGEKNVELAQEILLPLVEAGNAEAQYYWGYIYDVEIIDNNGDGEKESLFWYELAAKQGFPKAYLATALNGYVEPERVNELVEQARQAGLFEMTAEDLSADGCLLLTWYYYGNENYSASLEWGLKASELGSTNAMTYVGSQYRYGYGVERNVDTALEWFLKAADLGDAHAMSEYGSVFLMDCHKTGYDRQLVEKEYTAALDGYWEAAEDGDPIATYNIGYMYEEGLGGLGKNAWTAREWYLKAYDLGDAFAMYELGWMYERGYLGAQDYTTAMDCYLKAAEQGDAHAMNAIADMYSEGKGVEKNSSESEQWQRKAFQNEYSIYSIGSDDGRICLWYDVYVLRKKAVEYVQKSADAGFAIGMNNIGWFGERYENGHLRRLTDEEVIAWYKKAAAEGNAIAMSNVGNEYYGDGDYDSAMEWYIKAYANGYSNTADKIKDMLLNKQSVNGYFENYGGLISANS